MGVVLEYAGGSVEPRERILSPFMMQLLLAYAHANVCWQVSQLMLASVCSHMQADFFAWTPLAWLPGSVATHYVGRVVGVSLMFLVSMVAGQMAYGVMMRRKRVVDPGAGALLHDWRTWATAALWLVWLPVPALFAFAYQFAQWVTVRG
ncbi:MAG: hypothetical protein ACTHN5_15975 [Phycisphaerae bacterium]